MRFILMILAAAVICTSASASNLIPAIANPGFESNIDGWNWELRGTFSASYSIDTANPHSGKSCIVIKSNTSNTPHCFARLKTNVDVIPGAKYELSCWVRGEEVGGKYGEGTESHWTDWATYTLCLPTGTFGWRKVTMEFTPPPGRQSIEVGLNVVNTCKALAIDDVVFRPLGGEIKGKGITGMVLSSPKAIGHNTPVPIRMLIDYSGMADAAVESIITNGSKIIAFKQFALKRGENKIDWKWNTGKSPFGKYDCSVRVVDTMSAAMASGKTTVEVVDSPVFADIDKVETRKKEFDSLYKQCKAKGIRLDYLTVAKTMLEQFIPLSRDDVRAGLDWRAKHAITDFNRTLEESIAEMKAYLADPTLAPVAKRFQTGKVRVEGLSFIGDRKDSTGKKDQGPVFFCGYGHFGRLRTDMPKWPGYGVNIIQHSEFGPSAVFPEEGKVDLTAVKILIKTLDDAAQRNVRVDFLISPHYFPQWAMNKYPQLAKGGGGFFNFCVDDPAAKEIVEKFLRIVLPMIKDKPALHSICLSNEPMFNRTQGCDNTPAMWIEYLKKTYTDINALNQSYGTSYKSFEEVPMSGDTQYYDYCIFNNERFAGWHKWMGDICHELAPGVPVHAKIMSTELNCDYNFVEAGDDHELFGQVHDLNGNDCYMFPTGNPNWPIDPWVQNTGYDMQRSFAYKPIFNSENHIAPDGSTYYMIPEHYRATLWQGAIHGQGATTIWVWERDFDNRWGFIGSVMDRPGSAQAVGTTCLDLNRFAEEVTALQTVKAPIAVVYSMTSMIRHSKKHASAVMRAYQALNFCGVKIDFISEKQLAQGKGKDYKLIIVPEVESITDSALNGLRALPASTKMLFMNTCFARNPYGKKCEEQMVKEVIARGTTLTDGDPEKVLWPTLRKELASVGALSEYSVVDANTNEPIWGIEWLPAKVGDRTVINMINFRSTPFEVKILRNGSTVEAIDLLSLGSREQVSKVKLLTPVLAEVK